MDDTSKFWTEELVRTVYIKDRVAHVELSYPDCSENPNAIQVGLQSVRAADDIRISYDFERDGWKIEQQEGEDFHDTDGNIFPGSEGGWREVAFIKAWALTRSFVKREMDPKEWQRRLDEACKKSLEDAG